MSDSGRDTDLARLAAELTRSLRDLQRELEPQPRRPRPPTPRELLRFTDEVAIPAVILLLETNIRALRLLQRALRLADGGDPDARGGGATTEVRDRAVSLSRATLDRLDQVLADAQDAIEGRPPDDDARQVLEEARSIRAEIDERLAEEDASGDESAGEATGDGDPLAPQSTSREVPVDVEAELKSLKDDLDEAEDGRDDDDTDAT